MSKTTIDLIAYKIEAYDSDDFIEDLKEKNLTCIVILFNPVKGYAIKGVNIDIHGFEKQWILLFGFAGHRLKGAVYNLLSPVLISVDLIVTYSTLLFLTCKYRPRNCYVDNTFVAVFMAYLRKKDLISNLVYASQDWLGEGGKTFSVKTFHSYCFSRFFALCDRYASKHADLTLNHTPYIQRKRQEYWKEFVPKNETLYFPNIRSAVNKSSLVQNDAKGRNKLLFIGHMLDHTQWSDLLSILDRTNYRLKLVGRIHPTVTKNIRNQLLSRAPVVEFLGYRERIDLKGIAEDCLAGINLIFGKDLHTHYAIPSKVVDYLRFRIPVIVSKDIGYFGDVVSSYQLGIVIENQMELLDAIEKIQYSYIDYRENIDKFFRYFPFNRFTDYLISDPA